MSAYGGPPRNGWRTFGIVLAVVLGIVGLAVIAAILIFVSAMNSWGSNK